MVVSIDCYKFSPFEFTDDFPVVFPTISCLDASRSMLEPEDYPVHPLDPPKWVCDDVCMSEYVNLPPLMFPVTDMEVDREQSMFHLLKAYGEAIDGGILELSDVILTRLCEKSSPTGMTMERFSHYLIQQSDPQSQYLKHESAKNYALAFRAFYEMTPYGKFANFVASASIQDCLPREIRSLHIVDFNVGDGIQWPPLLAALGPHYIVLITCLDFKHDDGGFRSRTKERLESFAQTMGLELRLDQMKLGELLLEKMSVRSNGASEREWLVFNCMVGFPHMEVADTNQKIQVEEFVRAAQELVASSSASGMLTYGTGLSGLVPYSDGHLLHSQALFESLEWHFEPNLNLARTTMECLFVGARVSSCNEWLDESLIESKFEGCRICKHNLSEVHEMVRGGNYEVKVREDGGNEMVFEWRGTPLVRVSAWR